MQLELGPRDVFYALSPVGCWIEAVALALLFIAMAGCAVAAF